MVNVADIDFILIENVNQQALDTFFVEKRCETVLNLKKTVHNGAEITVLGLNWRFFAFCWIFLGQYCGYRLYIDTTCGLAYFHDTFYPKTV